MLFFEAFFIQAKGRLLPFAVLICLLFAYTAVAGRPPTKIHLYYEKMPAEYFDSVNFGGRLVANVPFSDKDFMSLNLYGASRQTREAENFPDKLYRASATLGLNLYPWSFSVGVTSNSDRLFYSGNEMDMMGIITRVLYAEGNSSVLAGLVYNHRRTFWRYIPIPFLAYMYRGESLFLSVGIPFIIRWKIQPWLIWKVQYLPVTNVETKLTWRLWKYFSISGFYSWQQENYWEYERENKDEFLFYEFMRAGGRIALGFVYGGVEYVFNSSYYRGDQYNDYGDQVDIKNSIMYVAGINLYF